MSVNQVAEEITNTGADISADKDPRALFNVTTNELVNWPRYAHFRGKGNSFHNPFDKGFRDNLAEFFRPGSTVLEEMPTADEDTKQETSYPFVV
ncbi:unnamed protein product [Dibothriocephalus latus]|uniref:Uncharacterized protein n=1 Tax=Dibothriocephalus latus TaxID=60516 RepID=A0A3P7NT69_DIBLA|nr:unnamed protein product [Dibothriocephalus latus]